GESANFVEALPGILFPLQAFDFLRFGFFDWICHKKKNPPPVNVYWRWVDKCRMLKNSYVSSLPVPEDTRARQQQQKQHVYVWRETDIVAWIVERRGKHVNRSAVVLNAKF